MPGVQYPWHEGWVTPVSRVDLYGGRSLGREDNTYADYSEPKREIEVTGVLLDSAIEIEQLYLYMNINASTFGRLIGVFIYYSVD